MTLRDVEEWTELTPWVVEVLDAWCDAMREAEQEASGGDDDRQRIRLDE